MSKSAVNLDLSQALKVSPTKIINCMQVALGSEVEAGDILAEKKSLLKKLQVKSPVKGKVESLSESGVLQIAILAAEPKKNKEEEDKPDVNTAKDDPKPKDNDTKTKPSEKKEKLKSNHASSSHEGELLVFKGDKLADLTVSKHKDKIIFFQQEVDMAYVYKAEAIGAKGVVFASGENSLTDEPIEIPVLFLTNKGKMMQKIKQNDGKKIAIIEGKINFS